MLKYMQLKTIQIRKNLYTINKNGIQKIDDNEQN